MATNKAKFVGWSFSFAGPQASIADAEGKRSRRNVSVDSKLVLTRESDGLAVTTGDAVLCNDPESGVPIVYLIKDASIGNSDYISLTAIALLRLDEVEKAPDGSNEQELFLTPVADNIYVVDIIEKANVLSEKNFKKIAIDGSNKGNTFLCRKGYDTYYAKFTADFDYDDIHQRVIEDNVAALEYLRNLIVTPLYKEKTAVPPKREPLKDAKPEPKKAPAKNAPPKKPRPTTSTATTRPSRGTTSARPKKAIPAKRGSKLKESVVSDADIDETEVQESDSDDSDIELLGSEDSDLDIPTDDEFQPSQRPVSKRVIKKPKLKGPQSIASQKTQEEQEKGLEEEAAALLPCREEQFTQLYHTIESSVDLEAATCIYVSGPPGTGKTATVREAVRKLFQQTKTGALPKFDYLEINGMKLLTPASAYEKLWARISPNTKVPASGLASALEEYFQSGDAEEPLVLLLDELDQIATKNQALLYNFFNWSTYEKSKLIVIAVANTMDLPEKVLSNKSSSRLGLSRITFAGYTHEELVKIITTKLELVLEDNITVSKDSIEFAARKVSSVSGDARRALRIIKRAIQLAKESQFTKEEIKVQAAHINRAFNESNNSPVTNYVTNLTFVGKLILVGILTKKRKSGLAENSLGDVIDEIKQIVSVNSAKDSSKFVIDGLNILDVLYDDFVVRPKGFTFILNELVEAGLVLLQNPLTERNTSIKLNVADEEVTAVFKKDRTLLFFANLLE